MTLPNFLVLGAAKCGTTSLYFYMQEHPEIFLAPKEFHFFTREKFSTGEFNRSDIEEYESLFNGVKDETAIGEVAIHYLTKKPWAADNIKSLLPNAKLIASLRNPVDRSFSHFLMHCRSGNLRTKDGSIVGGNPSPAQIDELFRDPNAFYINGSMYYKHLKRYYALFPNQQIFVSLLEDLETNANEVMQKIFHFLEVDDTFLPNTASRYNVAKAKSHNKILMLLRDNKTLKQCVRKALPRNVIETIYRRRKKDVVPNNNRAVIQIPPEVRIRMNQYFKDDISQLEDLIDRDLSLWSNINHR